MATPTNLVSTYDQNHIREDMEDVIYDVSPEDTPLLSSLDSVSAESTYHEWNIDALRSSAENAHLEGDDSVGSVRAQPTRMGNRCQIFKDTAVVSGTDEAVKKAGKKKAMAREIIKMGKEQKLDIEKAFFANQAQVTGDEATARKLAGLGAWIKTNTNIGATGANPTGNGTVARTDGTNTALTQTRFDDVLQQVWSSGGKPDVCYTGTANMNIALGFTGNNNQRATIGAADGKVANLIEVYVTPWGKIKFIPTREQRARDVWIIETEKLAVAKLRGMRNEELAKTGDSEKRHIVSELTLVCRNEKAHGLVADCA